MIIHASAESSRGTVPGTFAIALVADSELDLLRLEQKLLGAGVPHSAFREPDPPYNGALMAVGIEPVTDRKRVKRFVGRFSLLGGHCGWVAQLSERGFARGRRFKSCPIHLARVAQLVERRRVMTFGVARSSRAASVYEHDGRNRISGEELFMVPEMHQESVCLGGVQGQGDREEKVSGSILLSVRSEIPITGERLWRIRES